MSAKELAKGSVVPEIYLAVAHCEKSVLEGDMVKSDLIQQVFTTNTIIDKTIMFDAMNALHGNKISVYDAIQGVDSFNENYLSGQLTLRLL